MIEQWDDTDNRFADHSYIIPIPVSSFADQYSFPTDQNHLPIISLPILLILATLGCMTSISLTSSTSVLISLVVSTTPSIGRHISAA